MVCQVMEWQAVMRRGLAGELWRGEVVYGESRLGRLRLVVLWQASRGELSYGKLGCGAERYGEHIYRKEVI